MASYICSASLNSVVGCIFRYLRSISDVGQTELAEITNLPASTISKIESGSMNITIELIFMLCSYYQTPLTEFFKVLESAIKYLQEDKVFIYLSKTDAVVIKDHTISIDKAISKASSSVFNTDLAWKGGAALAAASVSTLPLTAVVLGGLGASALLSISNPILGALSARKNKKNASEDEKYDSLIEHAIEETDGNEKIDLPILSAKQIYAILKERLDNLEIAKLSQEQKILYKKFVEKTGEE